ncbi:hypothetical protein X743_19605 [Mesorhizobium sp. LNHC252B00]|nr:hypothetical protein X743_19605 [Mesorhizobium sp. LNHC252B00]
MGTAHGLSPVAARLRPLFELKQQGARFFDRGPAIV